MREQGTVTEWNDERGFGFITRDGGGSRLFVHVSAFPAGRRPVVDEAVSYIELRDQRDRPRAGHVRYLGPARGARTLPPGMVVALVTVGLFAAVLAGVVLLGRVHPLLPVPSIVLSGIAFELFRADKSAAQRGAWRVSESTLHAVDVLGGWPGALIARQLFRHKTTKQPFVAIFWATVLANCAILAWLVVGPSSPLG